MKKIFLHSIFILALCTQHANAQLKGFSIGPHIEAGWPTGNFKNSNTAGYGIGLSADIKLPAKLGLTGSVGYMQFPGINRVIGETNEKTPAVKAFPIRAGIKFRALPIVYFKLEAGTAKFMNGDKSAFIASPGIGMRLLGFDILGKYEAWFRPGAQINFWGLKAGINF